MIGLNTGLPVFMRERAVFYRESFSCMYHTPICESWVGWMVGAVCHEECFLCRPHCSSSG